MILNDEQINEIIHETSKIAHNLKLLALDLVEIRTQLLSAIEGGNDGKDIRNNEE